MRGRSDCWWEMRPFAAMVAVVCLDVGLTTMSKAAMDRGMSHFVFVFYSNALAAVILLPSSFIFHRAMRLPLTFSLLCRFFILGLIGITLLQNCVFTGINYSNPTLGSAISNLTPAFTFILAFIFRMEKFDVRNLKSLIKVMGTIVSISGALIVILYKGPSMGKATTSPPLITSRDLLPSSLSLPSNLNSLTSNKWVLGGFFLAIASLSSSIWQIFQAATVKGYPAEMTIVSFNSFFASIQCLVVSLIAERDLNVWKLKPDLELISIVYSAVFGSVITPTLQTWCLHKKGPVFVAMFTPVGIAIATILGVIFLGDTFHLGSLIGAAIIVLGFYAVIWGQSKEEKDEVYDNGVIVRPTSPSTNTVPLLQNVREV